MLFLIVIFVSKHLANLSRKVSGFFTYLRSFGKVWDVSSLPVKDDRLAYIVDIGFSTFKQLASSFRHLRDEIFTTLPRMDSEHVCDVFLLHSIKNGLDVGVWVRNLLSTNYTFKYFVNLRFTRIVDYSWAVNQVNSLGQGDVLPMFCLTRNGCNFANLFLHQGIDHRGLAHIWIADESNTDAFLLSVQVVELLQKLNQRPFAEWIGHTRLEAKCGSKLLQVLYPFLSDRCWDQITFVKDEHKMLGRTVFL